MKKAIFLLLFTVRLAYAQNAAFDSLEQHLQKPGLADAERITILNTLAREYIFVSITKSVEYASDALRLSRENGDRQGEAYALRNLASIYYVQQQYFAGAEFIEQSLLLFEELDDAEGIGNCYITQGYVNRIQHNYKKSVEYLEKATSIFRKMGSPDRLAASLYNLSLSQMFDGDFTSARASIYEVIDILNGLDNLLMLSPTYRVLGIIEFRQGNHSKAEDHFSKVLDISARLGSLYNKEAACESLIYLAKIAEAENKITDECRYITEAIRYAKENQYADLLIDAYMHYIRIDLRRSDFKNAERKLLHLKSMQDSINTVKDQNQSQLMETALNVLKTMERNKQLQTDKELTEQIVKTQKKQIAVYAVSLITIILLASILLYYWHRNKRTNLLLTELNKIIREKSARLENLNDTKNRFFSIVAHDLKSPLNTLKGFVHLLQKSINSLNREEAMAVVGELDKNLSNTMTLADKLILWARTQMETVETNPDNIQLFPLIKDALKVYSSSITKKELYLTLDVQADLCAYADQNHTDFLIRNLIHNAVKFTPPNGAIKLTGKKKENFIEVSIKNTVQSLNYSAEDLFAFGKTRSTPGTAGEKGSGLGLVLCREFAQANNGNIKVVKHNGSAVEFVINLPESTA